MDRPGTNGSHSVVRKGRQKNRNLHQQVMLKKKQKSSGYLPRLLCVLLLSYYHQSKTAPPAINPINLCYTKEDVFISFFKQQLFFKDTLASISSSYPTFQQLSFGDRVPFVGVINPGGGRCINLLVDALFILNDWRRSGLTVHFPKDLVRQGGRGGGSQSRRGQRGKDGGGQVGR